MPGADCGRRYHATLVVLDRSAARSSGSSQSPLASCWVFVRSRDRQLETAAASSALVRTDQRELRVHICETVESGDGEFVKGGHTFRFDGIVSSRLLACPYELK